MLEILREQPLIPETARQEIPKTFTAAVNKYLDDVVADMELYHVCPGCDYIFLDNVYLQCPVANCGAQRFDKFNRPRKVFRFFPITKRLKRFMRCKTFVSLALYHATAVRRNGEILDVYDGQLWNEVIALTLLILCFESVSLQYVHYFIAIYGAIGEKG